MKKIRIDDLYKEYSSRRGHVAALAATTFDANEGEFIALLGPSGCGKSSLLRIVAGLITQDRGDIEFHGWPQQPKRRLVFQENALFPWMTVQENVAFGLEMEGVPLKERTTAAMEQLSMMGMSDFSGHYPHELSGGMRQRAAIARAFVTAPDILLMDEPLRALDAQMRLVIQEELHRLWRRQRPIVLYVTHDIEEALLLADRVLVMSGKPGRIREEVKPAFEGERDLTGRSHPEMEELKWHIWHLLEKEVRTQLQAPVER